ncbi:MAG: hypothetical protein WC197_09860 [Candidatus Gastranaerophilaceae bacterium]|jgi:hypothetical protein
MIPVRRNGIFQYTEKLEPNDILIPHKPHPCAELDEFDQWRIDIEKVRQIKIAKFKNDIAPKLVYEKAPEYKQVNSALGIYPEEKRTEIINWIQAVRKLTDEIEAEINAAEDVQQIDDYNLDFELLKSKTEEIENGGNKDDTSNN